MYKAKHDLKSRIYDNTLAEIRHRYPTRFPRGNFKQPKIISKATSFVISSRWSKIWNNYLHGFEKPILFLPLFLNKLKNQLLEFRDELALSLTKRIAIDPRDRNLHTLPTILCTPL